jgi:transposase
MAATHAQSTTNTPALYLAFDLGWTEWKLAFSTAPAEPARLRTIAARDLDALQRELAQARQRWGLADDVPVRSCYEAGRDGFWLHRWLGQHGVANVVVDASSIEVNRRARRAKSDRLDAAKLLQQLQRYHGGEPKVWCVVHVPAVADEDRRQVHRDLLEMKAERTQHSNRIKGLLAGYGLAAEVNDRFAAVLPTLRTWEDQPVPAELHQRLLREHQRWQFVHQQIKDVENERARRIRTESAPANDQVRRLLELKGIGRNSAWLFVMEFFAWRRLRNRKQLGALAGLTPTPYQSGDRAREQGISKAGNRRLRAMAVEIAWCWLQWQPQSALSQWYEQRFGGGNSRRRRIGVVAVARKLLVALWRYLETGEVPAGAKTVDWRVKMGGRKQEPSVN